MNLTIRSIADRGDPAKERIVFRADEPLDIGQFLVLRSAWLHGAPSTDITQTFWFPNKDVGNRDLIVLYSKRGADKVRELESGRRTHFFYWNSDAPLWADSTYVPVLAYSPEWRYLEPADESAEADDEL
ncbi:hypothetical protein [Pseudoxanthomonas winnipegensis]|uniref:Uncharacterized protein n=1 Tax=Pseudoxanthomonas winnipegensis TaxID=2480810 RepID=A0A4Q8M533_9GAMM|nr:hypothetical protein [Pseudoxanthomonas winnipegensis]TAA42544.1 hypothetical protein EA655_11055 [Pseudoxanthomonas winnipegensis]